jgi:hypothetical protein
MERALAKNPEDRFQTGGELFMACRELIMTEEDRQALPQEHEKTTVVTGGQTDEASQVEVTSNPQLTSISDIDEIFRDLTTGHRTLRLDQSASKTRVAIWIAWIAAILAAAALVLWIIFGGR